MNVKIESLVKFYTVLLLNEGSKHGYELIKELKKKLNRKIGTSQVYPFLGILQKNHLIVVEEIGGRKKKTYKLTTSGKSFVNSMLQRFGDLLHIAMEPKLTLCTHCGCKVYEGGHEEIIKNKKLKFCCHHCAMSFKKHKLGN